MTLLCFSCAGPTTPFGALTIWAPAKKSEPALKAVSNFFGPLPTHEVSRALSKDSTLITFTPKRQVLHGPSQFSIVIDDAQGISRSPVIRVLYNGHDVTRSFIWRAKSDWSNGDKRLSLTFSDLRILPTADNTIEVIYQRNPQSVGAYAQYLPPHCAPFEFQKLKSTGEFNAPDRLIASVEGVSKNRGVNPNMLAGLIAQESGFNPYAISHKRALGLTQITSLAEEEILKSHPEFPQFPHINEIEIPILRWMITAGKINEQNEWRLHPDRSLNGALTYLNHIKKYWEKKDNWEWIEKNYQKESEARAVLGELMLASYHSGPARIKRALIAYGSDWLRAPHVLDARYYVNRITSFCSTFSEE